MRLRSFGIAFFLLVIASIAAAGGSPSISHTDRVRLAEAFRLADAVSDEIWPGWSKAPFALILVTEEHEFLVRHPRPSDDFVSIGRDELLGSEVFYRKRQFPTNFLATFPAVAGVSTILIGRAENTAVKTSGSWVVTVLHEHFHQMQESGDDYYSEVNALGLSGGDQTGMWMINYKFPYQNKAVEEAFSEMTSLLLRSLDEKKEADINRIASDYRKARQTLKNRLSDEDFRYFEFQVWKEGIARYTEHRVAEIAARNYEPSPAFQALPDFDSFADVAEDRRKLIRNELRTGTIANYERVLFYPVGAAEGLLLDRIRPGWQKKYFARRFSLGYLYDPAP
ncbi:MAG: hypothetical protein J5I65_15040 [Aridibacter famidurans]|nr:hypothetical protein [Aridibacter famidurans]